GRLGPGLPKRQGIGKKRGELVFLAWFSLQRDQQSDRDHRYLLSFGGHPPAGWTGARSPRPGGRRTSCGTGIAVVPSFSVGVAGVLGRRQPRPNGRTLLLPSFSGM